MSLRDYFIVACLVLAALGLGCWLGQRDERKTRDHRQPLRYWRP